MVQIPSGQDKRFAAPLKISCCFKCVCQAGLFHNLTLIESMEEEFSILDFLLRKASFKTWVSFFIIFLDDTNEIEAKVPLESPEIRGMEVGSLTLRLKYIIGKMHIGGLHPFSQMDLTFENMTSKIYEGGAYQQSNLKGSQNQGTPQSQLQQTPPSQVRSPQSNLGSNRDPSRISQFNTGNQNIPYQAT